MAGDCTNWIALFVLSWNRTGASTDHAQRKALHILGEYAREGNLHALEALNLLSGFPDLLQTAKRILQDELGAVENSDGEPK